jgi:UDP-N-acetylmuramoyl-tripeptide--D-alanyl-D-alanine ligase
MNGGDSHPQPWSGQDLIRATGARRVCGDPGLTFSAIGIDSRTLAAGEVFVALQGEHHDGHRFAPRVAGAGGRGLIVAHQRLEALPVADWDAAGVLCLAVDDTLSALGDLARFHRDRNPARVVAITGSNGKTTTRAMTAAVLGRRHAVAATRGNFNNAVGLPLSLFALSPAHRWAVFEIGMNHPGEIDRLAWICRPDLGVITNIGPAHLEGLGSLKAVRDAKGELLDHLGPSGLAVLNADDPLVMQLAARAEGPRLLFGTHPQAAVRAEKIVVQSGRVRFDLVLPGQYQTVRLAMAAPFMVANALAAAAVGWQAGLDAGEIGAALEAFQPVTGRLVRQETARGVTLIDDTYNANPASVTAALEALAPAGRKGRAVLVLGDMRELGAAAAALHRQVGERAAAAGLDQLWIAGEMAAEVAAGARRGGMAAHRIRVARKDDIADALAGWLAPGDLVLVKGSRAMRMETVVAALNARLKE